MFLGFVESLSTNQHGFYIQSERLIPPLGTLHVGTTYSLKICCKHLFLQMSASSPHLDFLVESSSIIWFYLLALFFYFFSSSVLIVWHVMIVCHDLSHYNLKLFLLIHHIYMYYCFYCWPNINMNCDSYLCLLWTDSLIMNTLSILAHPLFTAFLVCFEATLLNLPSAEKFSEPH